MAVASNIVAYSRVSDVASEDECPFGNSCRICKKEEYMLLQEQQRDDGENREEERLCELARNRCHEQQDQGLRFLTHNHVKPLLRSRKTRRQQRKMTKTCAKKMTKSEEMNCDAKFESCSDDSRREKVAVSRMGREASKRTSGSHRRMLMAEACRRDHKDLDYEDVYFSSYYDWDYQDCYDFDYNDFETDVPKTRQMLQRTNKGRVQSSSMTNLFDVLQLER